MRKFRLFFIGLGMIIGLFVLYIVGAIAWASMTDYEPSKEEYPELQGQATTQLDQDTVSLLVWNLGYGGLGKEADFFYDGGEMVRSPKEWVDANIKGITSILKAEVPHTDFFLLQEVDSLAKRSYEIDEVEAVMRLMPDFSYAFAKNYDVSYVPIPILEPMGGVLAGLLTTSRYHPISAVRHSFEGNYDWPTYLFFLDRCFLEMRFELASGKELVLINTHNSAYDDGSLKRTQMEQLQKVLLDEYKKGNYVIVGGDWNQFPPGYKGVGKFDMPQTQENKGLFISEDYPDKGWQWTYDPHSPTNRNLSAPFDADTTQRYIIDFCLTSPNIAPIKAEVIETGFAYSDHQPIRFQFRLR